MASTKDAYRQGKQDANQGRAKQTLDSKLQAAYDQGYSDAQAQPARRRTHRVIKARNVGPFNLG